MIAHLRDEAAKYGLKMHLGKTKILSLFPPGERPESSTVGTTSIEVLREGVAERYLGRKLTLDNYQFSWLGFVHEAQGCAVRSKVPASSPNETV